MLQCSRLAVPRRASLVVPVRHMSLWREWAARWRANVEKEAQLRESLEELAKRTGRSASASAAPVESLWTRVQAQLRARDERKRLERKMDAERKRRERDEWAAARERNRDPSAPLVSVWHDFPRAEQRARLAEFRAALARTRDAANALRFGGWLVQVNDEADRVAHNLRSTLLRAVIKDPLLVPPNFPRPSAPPAFAPAIALARITPAPLRNSLFQADMATEGAVLEERAARWNEHIRAAREAKGETSAAPSTATLESATAKEHAQQSKFIAANETATGIVAVGQVRDGNSGDPTSQIAVAEPIGNVWQASTKLFGEVLGSTRAGQAALAVRERVTKSDNEIVAKTFEALGEVRDSVQLLKTKLIPETETALAIGAVRARMPNFEPDSFASYLENDFFPMLFKVLESREFAMLPSLCTDGVVTQIAAVHRARQAAGQTQRLEILDIKRIELHEGLMDGQEPQLRFMVGVTQLLFVLDKGGSVVEGSESDPMLAYYDCLMVINPDGPTSLLRRGFRCARLQLVSQQPTW
jgi:hypothetical protein